jgi:hypothetical protein
MSAGSEAQIISMLRQKSDNGNFSPLYLGPEQRYIGALRKSNNNNIEEQLLLGVDRIITSWNEDNVKREHIEFRDNEDPNETGYYILDSYIYGETSEAGNISDAIIEGNALIFNADAVQLNDNILEDLRNDGFMTIDDDENSLLLSSTFILLRDMLRFKQSNGNILAVSGKITMKKYGNDGKDITKEIITNFL